MRGGSADRCASRPSWARDKLSSYYQEIDRAGEFDYELFRLPQFGARTFRGPAPDISAPYVAFIGGAHTFGRFVAKPFPAILGSQLAVPILNLGVGGAGPRHFVAPDYEQLLGQAEAVVVQIMSGRSASNSLFDNRKSGGHVGHLRADQAEIRSDQFLASFMRSSSEEEIRRIVAETRADYMRSFVRLLRGIDRPKILLWFSTREPAYADDYSSLPYGILNAFPQLVNKAMVAELAEFADTYVQCVTRTGLPQQLWQSDASINGAMLNAGTLENHYYPSPAMHCEAADALEIPCRRMTGRYQRRRPTKPPRKFVIIAAERTGTNLLIGLLDDYPGCLVGKELFNPVNIRSDILPWPDLTEDAKVELLKLRREDPVGFWTDLCRRAAEDGHRVVGFKLLYGHAIAEPDLLKHLAADKTSAIIHLTRRNQLRRLVSERQASATGNWAVSRRKTPEKRPAVHATMEEILSSFRMIEKRRREIGALFNEHRVMDVVYEDLAERPLETAARVARFLDLEAPPEPPVIKYNKTGTEHLPEALIDFEMLRARLVRWAAFFDD